MVRPLHSRHAFCLILVAGLCAAAAADPPAPGDRPLWSVTTVSDAPSPQQVLDGQGPPASCLTGFLGFSSGKLSRSQPLVGLARDAASLHLAWRIPRLNGKPFRAEATERDGALWNDDSLEVFLDPTHSHRDYFQFIVNSAGALYDGRVRDAAWHSHATVRVAQGPAAWAGVLSVPLSDLGADAPAPWTLWGANFAVDRSPEQRPSDGRQDEDAIVVWSPVSASLHEPARSGHLVFSGPCRVVVRDLGRPWWRELHVTGSTDAQDSTVTLQDAKGAAVWQAPLTAGVPFDVAPPQLAPGAYRLVFNSAHEGHAAAQAMWPFDALAPMDVRLQTFALRRELRLDARLTLPDPPAAAMAGLRLLNAAGEAVRSAEQRLDHGAPAAPVAWSFAGLPPGDYTVEASVAGRPETATRVPWQLPAAPAWLGSKAGRFDDSCVLKPWTPLRVAARRPLAIDCWGRRMTFGSGGLPASVVAKDQELLASAMEWVAAVDGQPVRWTESDLRVTRRAAGAVEFTAHQAGGGLRIDCRGRMEFDGFVRLDCTVSPSNGPVTLDRLGLRIPFRGERARLLHHFPKPSVWVKVDMSRFNARAVPADGWRSPFLYHLWVGDEERGLQWLTESDQFWRPADPERAIELIPQGARTVLSLNLSGKPTRLGPGEPRPYSFAFQAGPVKPTPPDYREWRYAQVGWYGMEKAPYQRPGPDLKLTYPAAGLFPVARGTVEITLTPHFDSTAPGELNRSLFAVAWPEDSRPEPAAGVWFYWNQDDRGMRVVVRQHEKYRALYGARFPWKPGETHTVAFTWGEQGSGGSIFVDRQKLASVPSGCTLDPDTDLSRAVISLGEANCDFTVRGLRISSEVLSPEQLGADDPPSPSTLLLDRFDRIERVGGGRESTPVRSATGAKGPLGPGVAQTPAGLDLTGGLSDRSFLDMLHERGLRTIGFHEGWSDWQGFPRTSHTEELRSLLAGCHKAGLKLILYHSWQLADIAPEYPLYLSECEVIAPDRFIYTREPRQKDYPVCARSAWADFMAEGIRRLFADFGPDGIYSDGLAYPTECANTLHGCGYVGEDGNVHPTFSLYAMRDAVKRFTKIMQDQGQPTLFVCHTSGGITLPTLSFCDAYLDAEHLTGQPRPFRLPLDAFRAEFMGHNFGLPAYFLVYDWNQGMTTTDGLAIALLHDTEVPWSWEAMTPIWNLWSRFGVSQARFLPYWRSEEWLAAAPEGVKVSAYVKPDGDALIVASNLSEKPVQGAVRLKGTILSASDALSTRPVSVREGALTDDFPVWTARVYRAKLKEQPR